LAERSTAGASRGTPEAAANHVMDEGALVDRHLCLRNGTPTGQIDR
jgi:hypothetical protein